MFWIQIVLSFSFWILGGALLARKPNPARILAHRLSRTSRVFSAAGLMLVCLAFLFLPLNAIASRGGLTGGPMTVPVWLAVTVSGGIFVVANTVSMAILATLAREAAVTEGHCISSTKQDLDK